MLSQLVYSELEEDKTEGNRINTDMLDFLGRQLLPVGLQAEDVRTGVVQFGFEIVGLFPQLGGFLAQGVGVISDSEHASLQLQLLASAVCA
jgi:hypothetical protein